MDRRRAAGALLALAACIACSAAAPTASNHSALDLYEGPKDGCYYNFQHYGEGDRIMTNEPCLNCTCHNRMLMCYLRVCPFTKPIGQDCTVEKRADQCCPIVTCPDVPVDLLTSTSTTSPAEYGATGLGKQDKYGCSINGRYLPEGSKVPPTPNKPCEHCYCIRNMTTCVMQECTLHVDGCTPIYHKDVCCPVRYSCDHPEDEVPLLDDMSTTVRPTPGFLLTTTTLSPVTQMSQDCVHNDQIISDGASITTEKACEHCYCMKGDIVCVVQECGAPMENEGKNCTSLPPREGQCCPDTYICEGDEPNADVATELVTDRLDEKLTTLPPRRTGVEGSGYRNEDEVAHTQMPTTESELEGSGEEQDSPQVTQEPVISAKPLDSEEIPHKFEEGDQYIPVTMKASEPAVTQVTETSSDILENETIEPQIPMITIQHLTGEDLDKVTEATNTEKDKTYEQEASVSPGVQESLESATMEPSEFLNTVPDIHPEQEPGKPHEYIPSTMATSMKESDTHVHKETEYSISTSSYNEQGITSGPVSQEPSVSGYTTESLEASEEIEDSTTKKTYNLPELVTTVDSPEPEKNVDTVTTISDLEVIKTLAPQTDITSETTLPEEDSGSSIQYASTIPTIEKIEKVTTELDQPSTVGIVEEVSISNADLAEKTTSSEHYIDVTSPVSITKEQELITGEPDKGLNTIPSKIDEDTTQGSLLETRNTEPTIAVDTTERIEIDTKLSTVSESSTLLLETHVTKGDQYTITTEPSFRREDEVSVSTEKPKEGLEITTVKTDLVDEGLIPTSMHDKEPDTSIPSIDEYITTGIPDYIDTDKELDDTIASVKPVTESVPTTVFGLDTMTEKVIDTTIIQESGFHSSTEEYMEVTVLTGEDDNNYEPSRIPGEGDCLLNAVTYRNNTVVPSSNKCHIGCMCVSSIIKCDPVICSPLPENMHNCQSIYDNPDSCCPTYICDSKETLPPKSDSQMSGTELPVPPPVIECRGDQCELSITKEPPKLIELCTSDNCVPEVVPDFKPENGQQILCNDEHGCKSQETVPSDCTGEEPCRRKDTDIDQTLPPKCEGSHCIQQVGHKATETSISDIISTESITHVPTEQELSQPIADNQVTKHGDTTPVSQIITDNVFESTEHSLLATTEREIISDKITEKIDVDIATEEFIPAGTEGTKKPDLFEQDGKGKPTKDETVSQTVDTKEDGKKPTSEEVEGETNKPEIYVDENTNKITSTKDTVTYIPDTMEQGYTDEPTITETQDASKPYEQPDKPNLDNEKVTNIPHDENISDTAIEEQTDKSSLIDTNVSETTDKGYDDKHSYTDGQYSNISEHINELDATQSILIEEEVTKAPYDISQNLDAKIPEYGKQTTEKQPYIEKDTTKGPNTEEDIKIPDLIVEDKTPTSFEDSFTKVPEISDDKYTESISDDRNTVKPEAIDDTITDVPPAVDEQTIKTNIPDKPSYRPDDLFVKNEGTEVPDLVKEDRDKIIPIEEVSTKQPGVDVEHYSDNIDVTGQNSTPVLDDNMGKQTEPPFTKPEISESVTEKGIITGDKKDILASVDKAQPDEPTVSSAESSEKTQLDKEKTQSVISEESTGLPEMGHNIVTIKPLLIDESTDLSVDMEDAKVTKTTAITEEVTTDKSTLVDNKMKDKPTVIEDGTKIPEVLYKDEDNELIDKEAAQETIIPDSQASTQASSTTEHELPNITSEADGSNVKDETQTDEAVYVTPTNEEAEPELYVTSINEQLPDADLQAAGKDKIPIDISQPTLGPVIIQTSSVSPLSEQDIKPIEPEIYTPQKEEMITSSIDSVTEPFKGFTEIDDVFATESEETTTKSQEKSTEPVEPSATEKEIPGTENASESAISDRKTTKAPEESYTESYQGYGETTAITMKEPSSMSQKPEISSTLPVSAEPPRRTSDLNAENEIIDSSEPTYTDLSSTVVTLTEAKPSMSLGSTDNQDELATKMPELSMQLDVGTPTSATDIYEIGVQTPTDKPESHVTELTEEKPKIEQSKQPQKPNLPPTSEDIDIPDTEKVSLEEYPHGQVITDASPSLVADRQPDISSIGESTTEKDDTKQPSPVMLTERPDVDLEVTKPIEEINIFTETTSVHASISETTPYLIELEEHTHKIAEDIPDMSTSEKTEITTSPQLEEENINKVEEYATISPATEKYESEIGSNTLIIAEKETSTTEKTSQSDTQIATDRITVSVNEIIDSFTTHVPDKIISDSDEKYGEPSVRPTSEKVSIEPSNSEEEESNPNEDTATEETLLPISKDEDRKPGEEIIPPVIIDEDGEPDKKPVIETTSVKPIVSEDKSDQTEKDHITRPEETLAPTTAEKDKKPEEKPVSGTGGLSSPVSMDKNVRPDELPSNETEVTTSTIAEDTYGKPGDKFTSGIEVTTSSVTDNVIINKETTIPSISTDTYKPEKQPSSESGEIITPLFEDSGDKTDVTFVSQTEVTTQSSFENKDNEFDSKPVSSENEESPPSVTEDMFVNPDEQPSGETGDIVSQHSEQKDDKHKPISGPEESVPSVSEDKYAKPDDTLSGEPQATILPDYQDKDRKPDGKPIDEIESSTSSGEQYDVSDRPGSDIYDNVKPLPTKDKDVKPDEKPITSTEETDISSTEDKYHKPDITDSSETEVTTLPISVDIVSKPVGESEKTTPSIFEDKYTTETSEILTSLPEDSDETSDKKPVSKPGEISPEKPSSEEKYDKPDDSSGSETETGVPPLSEGIYSKPDGKPTTDSKDTTLPVSTDKYDKVDEKPSIELDKIVPPISEDKESILGGKPISETEENIATVSYDKDEKPEKKPTSETEDIVTSISEEKDSKPEPISGLEDIVPTVSDGKLPEKEVISGNGDVSEESVSPVSEDKGSQPDEQSISSSEKITPADKDSKPSSESEQAVPPGSDENDTKLEEKPISDIEEIVPSVSKDKDNQPEEEPVTETVLLTIEDKDSKPDKKPVSGFEETMPSVAEEDNSKIDKKPISKPEETILPGAEDEENKADKKPTSGIEETQPPVVRDKDNRPHEESITETVDALPPTSEDQDGKPDHIPISETGDAPTAYGDGDNEVDQKPITESGEIVPPLTQDKDSELGEKPISEPEETERPVTGDKDSKPDEKPITDIKETLRPDSEDKESKPDERPHSEIEGILPTITKDKEKIPEEPTIESGETVPPTFDDTESKPDEKHISESGDTTPPTVTTDKDSKPEEKPISETEETTLPATGDKDSQPEEKPISGVGEIVSSVSEDKNIKPDDSLSNETDTSVSEDKDSKPDEKPITQETEPAISEDKETKPYKKPISDTEKVVAPVTDDKFTKPESEAGATIPTMPVDKYSKPDEIPTSQTTQSTPPVAADNYGKPDEQSSEDTLPTSATSEIPKPLAETHPTDELPVPEEEGHFPPSGTGYGEPDYVEEDQAFGPGTCRYGGKVYVSAQQIPRDDPCDFCFCFRSDIICLQQSCPPPIHGCHEEPIQGFCCPRYECPVSMATTVNVTTTTTTTTTTLPPHFPTHSYKGAAQRRGCQIKGHTYKVGDVVRSSSGPCLHCTCGGDGQMKCDPKACTPEPMLRQMIAAAVSAKRRR